MQDDWYFGEHLGNQRIALTILSDTYPHDYFISCSVVGERENTYGLIEGIVKSSLDIRESFIR